MSRWQTEHQHNRAWWDERAGYHLETELYRKHIDRLEKGGVSLLPLEVRELGELGELDVLHLQCHVGTDTISLARLGAHVTGLDFSAVAIEKARQLSARLGIAARFEQAQVGELGTRFADQFDLVFTSYGVISWLPDLEVWTREINTCLRPGGRFYIVEMHPLAFAMADESEPEGDVLTLSYPYLPQDEPLRFDGDLGSYADRERPTTANSTREWSWGLGDVVNALLGAGFELRWLREHAEGFCPQVPGTSEGQDGHYRLPASLDGQYPLTFSIMADKRQQVE